MIRLLTTRSVNKGQYLYREGDRADKIYLVIQGEFKVTKKVYIFDNHNEDKLVIDNSGQLVKRSFR